MKSSMFEFFKRKFRSEPKLHPIDRGMAKRWIKSRLLAVFPELRNDPHALEQTYKALSLEPRLGGEGGMQTHFEVILPGL